MPTTCGLMASRARMSSAGLKFDGSQFKGVERFIVGLEAQITRRRDFLSVLGGALPAWPTAVLAQKIGKLPTVGVLWHAGSAEEEATNFTGLMEGLR